MSDKVIVTGCAGFIGSHLVERLIEAGHYVIGLDNLSTGRMKFISTAMNSSNFEFNKIDLLNSHELTEIFNSSNATSVYHLAANADVRFGLNHPNKDLEQNTIVTFHVLEAMRQANIKEIIFSSTGSVYGEASQIPTPENTFFPIQTSLYGASKLACEGLISAYSIGFGLKSFIFRFVSILGERYSHGHVFDFYKQLKSDPYKLNVLGDGTQTKSYLNVHDCIDGILTAKTKSKDNLNIFNLGINSACQVKDSIRWITEELKLNPKTTFQDSKRGWIGDNPYILLDTKKINDLGWQPRFNIEESIKLTVNYLKENEWLFDE